MIRSTQNKILIVGGSGFVGGYLTGLLSKEKNCLIHVLHQGLVDKKDRVAGAKYLRLDLSKPISEKKFLPVLRGVDMVVIMTPPQSTITENIFKILRAAVDLKKIIHVSTLLVYPSSTRLSKETVKPKPFSQYEKDKIREENLLEDYCGKNKIKLSILRLANVYGDIKNRGIVGLTFQSLKNGSVLTKNGDGNQVRDYIFITEAAAFIKSAILLKQAKPIEVFNICIGKGHTINELLSLVERVAKRKLAINQGPRVVQEKKSIIGDSTKLAGLLGHKPKIDLAEGIRKTYSNYHFKKL